MLEVAKPKESTNESSNEVTLRVKTESIEPKQAAKAKPLAAKKVLVATKKVKAAKKVAKKKA